MVLFFSFNSRKRIQTRPFRLGGHVGGNINLIGELGNLDLEAGLDSLEDLLVAVISDKGDSQTLGTETTSTTDTVEVGVGNLGNIVVDDDVDAGNINTTGKDIGSDQDTLVELLERLEAGDTLILSHLRMNADGGEVALDQELVELVGAAHGLDENADLVELESIQQIVELAVLALLVQVDVVLLQTVKGELGLVVDVDLERVLHKALAHLADLLAQSGREHHDLLVVRGGLENLLHIAAHVYCR